MPNSLQPSVAAVILAAGRSSRMGQAKQLLPLGGATVIETTLANVRRSAVEEIVLVLGAAADTIRGRLSGLSDQGVRIVVNQHYAQGMATSLHAGLSALSPQTTAALIVLADQPFVAPQTLDHLIAGHRRSDAHILIPTYEGVRGNPVLLHRAIFPEVMRLQGDVGCRALFAGHPQAILNVQVEDEGVLLDLDNQEDYQRGFQRLREGFPPRTGE